MPALPMFPLGSVLLPGMAIPLHVFEPRYRQLVHDCLAGSSEESGPAEFGVVLIARGSEVGGGDVRTDAGTVAQILEAAMVEDGRWYLVALGTRRIRVRQWLEDDPYPRAEVEDWPDAEPTDPEADRVAGELVPALRRVLALRAELGESAAPVTIELAEDPVLATWQVAAAGGVGPLDLHKVLTTDGAADRRRLVAELLGEVEDTLRAQLAG